MEGASPEVCVQLGIPEAWAARCEDAFHVGHDGSRDALGLRIEKLLAMGNVLTNFGDKGAQLGSYGGGNHFGEAEVVHVRTGAGRGLRRCLDCATGAWRFWSHCGSRGFGYQLASNQFSQAVAGRKFAGVAYAAAGGDKETGGMRRWARRRRMRILMT